VNAPDIGCRELITEGSHRRFAAKTMGAQRRNRTARDTGTADLSGVAGNSSPGRHYGDAGTPISAVVLDCDLRKEWAALLNAMTRVEELALSG
jgi:hypothetical protein